MNGVLPIVIGTQIAFLSVAIELATTEVVLQGALALLGMRFDQNPVLGIPRMTGRDQKRQCLIAVWIVFDLIGLRVRRGNHLISFEMMMNDSPPSRNQTLTELRHASYACVTAFNPRERVVWSKLFVRRHADPVVVCNSAEILTEHADS